MIDLWIHSVLFFLPAFVANGAPPVGKRIPIPILSKTYVPIAPRLLGENKTFGGFISASAAGTIVGLVFHFFSIYSYGCSAVLAGFSLGFFSCLGDSLGSFIKRRQGKEEGEFVLYDWADWLMFGAWIVAPFINSLTLVELGLSLSLVLVVAIVGYFSYRFTSFKDSP